MSNFRMMRMLRNGGQTPVKLIINKLRTKRDLIRLLAANLEPDSTTFRQILQDTAHAAQYGLDTNTIMCLIRPDTYEFFWNTSAENALRKLAKSYSKFWDSTRINLAKAQGLSPHRQPLSPQL